MPMSETGTEVVRYSVDPKQGCFIVQAIAEGLFSAFGHNPTIAIRDFEGVVELKPGALESAELLLKVKADSLKVTDGSEKDRKEIEQTMSENVLETARFPEIVFKSTRVSSTQLFKGLYLAKGAGQLTLHGVTRQQVVEVQVTLSEDRLRIQGETKLRQSDYKIKIVSIAGGTLKVKDEVKLTFDLTAKKESQNRER